MRGRRRGEAILSGSYNSPVALRCSGGEPNRFNLCPASSPMRLALALVLALALAPTQARAADKDLVDYSKVNLLMWMGSEDPDTFGQYSAARPAMPLAVAPKYLGVRAGREKGKVAPGILIVVNSALYPEIETNLATYVADVEAAGYAVDVYECAYGTAEELKAFILGQPAGLAGCVFIGDIPCAWYEVENDFGQYGYASFPCDLFLCDLDGNWGDDLIEAPMQEGVYDSHDGGDGDEGPEIFIGRIDASGMTGGTEADLTNAYLEKLHMYYSGTMQRPTRALTYIEDDWSYSSSFWTGIANAYPQTTEVVKAPDTNRDDYRDVRLPSPLYEFIQLACHSYSGGHSFTRGGWVSSNDVKAAEPVALVYNLFCCSAARFTNSNCLAGAYIFNESATSLAALGSTKTGSMLGFSWFYQPLGEYKSVGESMREWFERLAPYSQSEIDWHFGMIIMGDPLLTLQPAVEFDLAASGGPEADSPAALAVHLARPEPNEVRVDYAVTGGTATAGEDYTCSAGTLIFAPGQVTKDIVITVADEDTLEWDETVEVTLSNAVNARLGPASVHTYTIEDDDYIPLRVRVTGIEWTNDGESATVSYEANQAVKRYYYARLLQTQAAYESTTATSMTFDGLEGGYYLFVVTTRDILGRFAPTPCRAWFFNQPVGEDYQVSLGSYLIADDGITFTLQANRDTRSFYVRMHGVDDGYVADSDGVTAYAGLGEEMYYFVATGREKGTGVFPPNGPARQFVTIVTDGF